MTKKTSFNVILILALPFLLASCKATFYTPNRNPVPLFKKKGDLYIDASTNFVKKADLTVGYAIIEGIGAYAGYSGAYGLQDITDSSSNNYSKRYSGQMYNFGLGYFLSEEQSERLRFEIYADYGMGNYRNKVIDNGSNQFLNGNYQRLGIMPNVGFYSRSGKLSLAYSLRYSMITFNNTSYSNLKYWQSDLDRLNHRGSYRLLEHCVNFRVGGEHVKFQLQGALYHNLDSKDIGYTNAIPMLNASLMFGIVVNTNLLAKKETSTPAK
jgi:hypothetical protein